MLQVCATDTTRLGKLRSLTERNQRACVCAEDGRKIAANARLASPISQAPSAGVAGRSRQQWRWRRSLALVAAAVCAARTAAAEESTDATVSPSSPRQASPDASGEVVVVGQRRATGQGFAAAEAVSEAPRRTVGSSNRVGAGHSCWSSSRVTRRVRAPLRGGLSRRAARRLRREPACARRLLAQGPDGGAVLGDCEYSCQHQDQACASINLGYGACLLDYRVECRGDAEPTTAIPPSASWLPPPRR